MSDFVGRAEPEVREILKRILRPEEVWEQVPFKKLIAESDFDRFDSETRKHKFDFAFVRENDILVVEVNYQHGPKSYKKWNNVFVPYLEASKVFQPKKIKCAARS